MNKTKTKTKAKNKTKIKAKKTTTKKVNATPTSQSQRQNVYIYTNPRRHPVSTKSKIAGVGRPKTLHIFNPIYALQPSIPSSFQPTQAVSIPQHQTTAAVNQVKETVSQGMQTVIDKANPVVEQGVDNFKPVELFEDTKLHEMKEEYAKYQEASKNTLPSAQRYKKAATLRKALYELASKQK